MKQYAYIPHPDFQHELNKELGANQALFIFQNEHFYLCSKDLTPVWAQQTWRECETIEIESIGDAQKKLKDIGGFWIPYSFQLHRRTQLIAEKIPLLKIPKLKFPFSEQKKSAHGFCLIEENKLLISKNIFPQNIGGMGEFEEDKNAPSRAYQKLIETFSIHIAPPKANEKVIDLGSCPGGWTYVLANLGCETISVDTAPLDPSVLKFSNVKYMKKDAFKLLPEDIGPLDWLFSDIICDPKRLLSLVQIWHDSGLVKNFVCTIKFKGETDFQTIREFQKIQNSRIVHLSCNKHELTWILTKN